MPVTMFDHDWTAAALTSTGAALTSTGAAETTTGAGQDGNWVDVLGSSCRVAVDGPIRGLLLSAVGGDPAVVTWAGTHRIVRPTWEARSDAAYTLYLPGDPDDGQTRMAFLRLVDADRSAILFKLEATGNPDQVAIKLHSFTGGNQQETDSIYLNKYIFANRHKIVLTVTQVDAGTTTIRAQVYDLDSGTPATQLPPFEGVDTATVTTAGVQRPGTFALVTGATGSSQFYTRIVGVSNDPIDSLTAGIPEVTANTPDGISATVDVAGGVTPYAYQWQHLESYTGATPTFADIPGATATTLTGFVPPGAGPSYLRCRVADAASTVTASAVLPAYLANAPIVIAAMGDSLTINRPEPTGHAGTGGTMNSIDWLVSYLRTMYGPRAAVVGHNGGDPGAQAEDWLPASPSGNYDEFVAAVRALDPPATDVPIMLGTNNAIGTNDDRATFAGIIGTIVDELLVDLPDCDIWLNDPPAIISATGRAVVSSTLGSRNDMLLAYSGSLDDAIAARPSATKLHRGCKDTYALTVNHPEMYTDEGIHMNHLGVDLGLGLPWARGMAPKYAPQVGSGGGTYTNPGVANVRSGTSYAFNGAAQVGTLVVPSLANTKTGVAGDDGVGTYDGSDRHTDPGVANVLSTASYKSNSTTNNRTGTYAAATAAQVEDGVAFGPARALTGTFVGSGGGEFPTAAEIAAEVWGAAPSGTPLAAIASAVRDVDNAAPAPDSLGAAIAAIKADTHAVKLRTDNLPDRPAAVGSDMGAVASVAGAVGSVTAPVTAGTVADKGGYSLGATGLDAIPMTLNAPPSTFREWLVWLTLRFRRTQRNKITGAISVYGTDGSTIVTTQTSTDTETEQTVGVTQ